MEWLEHFRKSIDYLEENLENKKCFSASSANGFLPQGMPTQEGLKLRSISQETPPPVSTVVRYGCQ